MKEPVLCSPDICTGCEACKNSCPESCISMEQDDEGFLQPHIDISQCKQCGICEKSCPIISSWKTNSLAEPKVYACWHNNNSIRDQSSSGGAFPAFATAILNNSGIIYGAAYDDKLHVQHIRVETQQELSKLQGSKYVQSEIGDLFKQIKNDLKNDHHVFFVGTPCQVAGLKSFLRKDYSKLLTADFICHGVPSPLVFQKYISELEKQYDTSFVNFNFRDKRHGWENNTVIGTTKTLKELHIKGMENAYYHAFIKGIFLRKACYKCQHIGLPRTGDITFADFWGIQQDSQISQKQIDKGISLLMLNNPAKSKQFHPLITQQVTTIERTLQEAKEGNSPMFTPSSCPSNRGLFFKDLQNQNYGYLTKHYLTPSLKRRAIQFLKEHCPVGALAQLRRIKRLIKH